MNAHKPMWFDSKLNRRGDMTQPAIETKNLLGLNEDQPAYYRVFDQASSHIDLALITDSCPTEYNWSILGGLHGSNHYPATRPYATEYTERRNLENACRKSY